MFDTYTIVVGGSGVGTKIFHGNERLVLYITLNII